MAPRSLLLLLVVVAGCATKPDPRVVELEKELAQVKSRLAALEQERSRQAAPSAAALYEQAQELELKGKSREAVKLYAQAARSGNGKAALRLSEIYDKGLIGVSRDYAESLKWGNAARVLGEDVPLPKSR